MTEDVFRLPHGARISFGSHPLADLALCSPPRHQVNIFTTKNTKKHEVCYCAVRSAKYSVSSWVSWCSSCLRGE